MRKRVVIAAAMWLAGALLGAIGVTAALNLLGDGIFGASGQVLSQADVHRDLARQPPAPASSGQLSPAPVTSRSSHPHPSSSRSPAAAQTAGSLAATGGTVLASCSAGQATLTGWFPAQDYQTDGYSRGPAASAWVKFSSGATEQTVSVTCAGDHPRFTASLDDKGGGGEHGGGGGGRGGGGGDH
jgi:hypothetical protein